MKIILLPAILLLLLILPLVIHDVMAATPQLSFGSLGSGPGQLDTPRGIAVDDSGNIYVADNRNHRVEKFDSSGNYVSEFDKGGIPEGIAVYNGTIYVVDRNSTNVKEFTPDGRLLYSFGSPGTNTGQLSNPERIAIDSSGNIYVADTGDIQKFSSKGNSISQFLADGKYQCCLNVMGVAVDASGNVYAADMEFHKIIKFSPTGSTLAEFNATFSAPDISGTPQDVAVDNAGNIYVADTYDGRIVKLDPTGNPVSALAISGVPVGLAIKGNQVYVVDIANSRVDMFLTSQFANNYTSVTPTDEQRKVEQLNKNSSAIDTAIKFAESSPQFQSLVEGYNYSFSSDFEESGPLSKGGIGLTTHGFAFELYSGPITPGKAVKVVEVLEDPTLTKILNVTSYPAVYMGPMMSATNATAGNEQKISIPLPLKQFKTGIAANMVKCNDGLQLIIKSEDGSPACIHQTTIPKLALRGWISINQLQNNTFSGNFYPGIENDSGTASIENKSYYIMTLTNQIDAGYTVQFHNIIFSFPYGWLVTPGGGLLPVTMTFPDGVTESFGYSKRNPDGSGVLSGLGLGPGPSSNRTDTILSSHVNPQAGVTLTEDKVKLLASADLQDSASVTSEHQSSQVIPTCVSNIQNQYAVAGPPGFPLCPVSLVQSSGNIVNSTGFYEIYNYTKFQDTQNFVLEPGHNATITYKISIGAIRSVDNNTSNEFNMTNYVTLMHDAEMHDHPGVYVSVSPTSEMIPQNGSAIITITLSATKDAAHGTYWMQLPPGVCFGGENVILTVTDCSAKK